MNLFGRKKEKKIPACPMQLNSTEILKPDIYYLPTGIEYSFDGPHTWVVSGKMTVYLPKGSILLGKVDYIPDRWGGIATYIINYQFEGVTHIRKIENGAEKEYDKQGEKLVCRVFVNDLGIMNDR